MPSCITSEFEQFVVQMGLRKELATKLWEADIHSPQELAALEQSDLMNVTDNPLLVKMIHPILQKYLFNISMAKDPYKKALVIIKKHAQALDSDDDEAMDTGISADSTVSDATAFAPGASHTAEGRATGVGDGIANNSLPESRYNNTTTRFNITGNQIHQSNFGSRGIKKQKDNDPGRSITITGGNFVQANVFGQAPVTYNNTNTVINTTMDTGYDDDVKKRRARLLNETMTINGNMIRLADVRWNDNSNYWPDNFNIPRSDATAFRRDMESDDVYPVKPQGIKRALILNNIRFNRSTGMHNRAGADVDCSRMEKILKELGFKIRLENDKTGAEMKTLLSDFAKSQENAKADMTVVYIGSHGERDQQGNDTFVGFDGVRVNFNEVREMFTPKNSPLLSKKPKMFLLQFCRQASPVHSDAMGYVEANPVIAEAVEGIADLEETRPMDMLCVYATHAGNKAYRDTADGSWFVTALIRIFKENAHKDDLLSMVTKVNNSVSVNVGMEGQTKAIQVSEVVHSLRKKIFFYPGLAV